MKNKNKLGLSLFTGLTTLSVATPLATSCAKTNKLINHVHESEEDKLYGINANTYESLKKDYISQYQDKLLQRGYIEGSEEWNNEINKLNYSLNIFDEKSKMMNMSYGQLTSSLMMYAKRNDRLSLHRTTNAKPSDIDDMYQGARNSFDLYMDQLGFSTSLKAQIFTSADNKFANLKTKLQQKGTMENDPYGALEEAKMSLLDFFGDINAQIARHAALITIVQFKKLYSITLKGNFNFSNFKEIFEKGKGKPMTDYINNIFDFIDVENGSTVTFREDIMTGYVLTPILNDVRYNAESNTNELDVSWSCISNTYLQTNDAETIKKATAYQYDLPDQDKLEKIMKSEKCSADDIYNICKIKVDTNTGFFKYQEEKDNLISTYFNDSADYKIRFKMPDASDPKAICDPFYYGADAIKEVGGKGKLSCETLAETGIKISFDGQKYEYLSDVLTTVSDPNFDEKNATLSQKFVKNCEIYAEIEETNRATHAVTVNIVSRYKQSCLSQTDSYNLDKWSHVSGTLKSEHAPISDKKFKEYCKNYSIALNCVDLYLDKKAETEMLVEKIALASACVGTALCITGIIYVAYRASKSLWPRHVVSLVVMSLGAISGLVSIAFLSKLVDESSNFSKKIDCFNKEPVVHATFEAIKTGKDIFVKMNGTDYQEFDQTEFDKKYEVAKEMDPAQLDKYNDLFLDVVKENGEFNQKALLYNVSKNDYLDFTKNHSINKEQNMTAYILCGVSVIIGLVSVVIIIYEVAREARKKREMDKFEEAALLNINRITNDLDMEEEEELIVQSVATGNPYTACVAGLTKVKWAILNAALDGTIDEVSKTITTTYGITD